MATSDATGSSTEYVVFVVRGYTKEKLAERIERQLQAYNPEDIISINVFADHWLTFFWRRNSAMITLRPTD